jgi:hypothetical protein
MKGWLVLIIVVSMMLGILYLLCGWIVVKVVVGVIVVMTIAALLLMGFLSLCGRLFGGLF